jgi:hypothetical protein
MLIGYARNYYIKNLYVLLRCFCINCNLARTPSRLEGAYRYLRHISFPN